VKCLFQAAIVALAMLLPVNAYAAPVTLACEWNSGGGTFTIAVDESAGTAGGATATFTLQEITWETLSGGRLRHSLNRFSGAYFVWGVDYSYQNSATCRAAQRQF
jgi:hypothetical protein